MTTEPSTGRRSSRRRLFTFGALLMLFACSVFSNTSVPPQQWEKGRGPVVPHDSFPADCTLCHVAGGWNEIRADFQFDHGAKTGVELHGAHKNAECLRCHNDRGPVAKYANKGCAGCHEDWHRRQLGVNCDSCHGETNWRPKEPIARHNRTRFPLIGAHAGVACYRCHEGAQVGNFKRADLRCESCHQTDLARTRAPNHMTAGWVSGCRRCHVPIAWKGRGFVHTTFPLSGAHTQTDCTKCHKGGVYRGTPHACEACHLQDAQRVKSPDHTATGWLSDCQRCHSTASFSGAHFVHTFWPLTGGHASQACMKCHANGMFKGTSTACESCHLDDAKRVTSPNHVGAGWLSGCQVCHSTASFSGANFVHDFWRLTGAHTSQVCAKCHVNGTYKGTSRNCVGCHQADYNATTNPNHQASSFPTTCQDCHSTTTWKGATFNHKFPLRKEHNVSCATCHTTPANFKVFNCLSCHEHSKAKMDAKHKNRAGYSYTSTACLGCHPNGK